MTGPRATVKDMPDPNAPEAWQAYTLAQARTDAKAAGEGLSTGFPALDGEEFRYHPGKLHSVAGRPGEGKTAFLLESLMRHVEGPQSTGRGPTVFISYEENLHDCYRRLLLREVHRECDVREVPKPGHGAVWYWLRTGQLPRGLAAERDANLWRDVLSAAAARLDQYGESGRLILLDGDQEGSDVDRLLSGLRRGAETLERAPSLVVVDYYQKIRPPTEIREQSRQLQLQYIADRLRYYAKGEENGRADPAHAVPVLVAAQVTREVVRPPVGNGKQEERRLVEPPELHHIREADDLANDSTGVLTFARRRVEEGPTEPFLVRVAKNRDGKRDRIVTLAFNGEYRRVLDAAADGEEYESDESRLARASR